MSSFRLVDGELVPLANEDIVERAAEAAAWSAAAGDRLRAALANSVQRHLDAQAKTRGYDSIFTAVTYAEEPAVSAFQSEGRAFRQWRSLVWAKCYEFLAEVQSGKRDVPTEEELLAALPKIVLP